jgi:ribosomal protein S18 acetylase RimI-like enzyme
MQAWKLRPLDISDIEALQATCWQHLHVEMSMLKMERLLYFISKQQAYALVVETSTQLIGYGQVMQFGQVAEIADLYITEAWRSKGIGTTLIYSLIQSAQTWQLSIELMVNKDNPQALQLYERLGFWVVGVREIEHEKFYELRWKSETR